MSAYVIFHYQILDRNKIDELTERCRSIDEKYGATVIVGSPIKTVEGSALPHMVIYKFASFEAATNWYYSEEQQELSVLRHGITEGWAAIVPGVSETEAVIESGYFECRS